jgi:uncharacterized delta-60 repeat protein
VPRFSLRSLSLLLVLLTALSASSLALVGQAAGADHARAPLPWRPGAAMPTFGDHGAIRLQAPGGKLLVGEHVAVDAAGRILLFAATREERAAIEAETGVEAEPQESRAFMTRLLPDGHPDPEFAGGGWVDMPTGEWEDAVLDPEGRILLAGGVEGDYAVARLDPDGTPDPSFGTDGVARLHGTLPTSGPWVRRGLVQLIALPEGGVLAVGSVGSCVGPDCSDASGVVVKLTDAGALDPSFGEGGVDLLARAPRIQPGHGRGVMREAAALAVQPDGKILVGGTDSRTVVVDRLTATGAPDPTFGDGGIFFTNRETSGEDESRDGGEGYFYPGAATSILVEPSGRIVVAGIRLVFGLRPDGRLDPRFGYPGSGGNWLGVTSSGSDGPVQQEDAMLDRAGRIITVGGVNDGGPGVARFLADGQADARFGGGGAMGLRPGNVRGTESDWTSVAQLPGGELVMAGYASFDRDDPHQEVVVTGRNDRDGRFAYCGGQRATYQGTPRSDGLGWRFGTLVTFAGNDRIFGAGGTVCTGSGDDLVKNRINFGKGEPIYLGPGEDRAINVDGHVFGGPGHDILVAGGEGEGDVLVGGAGNDRLAAASDGERQVLKGGPGNDVLIGGPEDVLIGGPGRDRIIRRPAPPEARDR